ncbi:SphA family protein [Flavobacterium sp.]|uniref:SphA family protein n=1 Tax=Flavobacterium sp. TaxID=239 RepID=UPI002ED8134E
MKPFKYLVLLFLKALLLSPYALRAQDPKLPAVNLGLVNMQDGNPPGPGIYFQQAIQSYSSQDQFDSNGNAVSGSGGINSLVALSQIIHLTQLKILNGNFGYTVIMPLVKINGTADNVDLAFNPNPVGDITAGPMIQWSDRHLAGMKLSHRLEADMTLPTGSYSPAYQINPSSHFYTFSLHHAFTLFPAHRFSISMRNHIHYNSSEIGTAVRAGMFYHNNYSFEYAVSRSFRVEVAGYYLKQLEQDTFKGDHNYYKGNYGISDTREQIFAIGAGLGYVTPNGNIP